MHLNKEEGIVVLSLFDGMSCGQIALKKLGVKVKTYYASEIDKYGQIVSKSNFPDTVYLGDVRNIDGTKLGKINLLIGGSPCQSFSFAGKRKGMATKEEIKVFTLEQYLELKKSGFEFDGQSYLFWEFMRLKSECKPQNFLLENVEMGTFWETILSRAIGIHPLKINSSKLSAQNRKRCYWTDIYSQKSGLFGDLICAIPQPKDKCVFLSDILETNVNEKHILSDKMVSWLLNHSDKMKEKGNGFNFKVKKLNEKSNALNARMHKNGIDDNYIFVRKEKNGEFVLMIKEATKTGYAEILPGECFDFSYPKSETRRGRKMVNKSNCLMAKETDFMQFTSDYKIRRLTPLECERLQTVPDGYTDFVSDTQRYKMLGNGWTVDVIAYIFSFLFK